MPRVKVALVSCRVLTLSSVDPRQKSVRESHQPAAEYSQFFTDEGTEYEHVLEYEAYDWELENERERERQRERELADAPVPEPNITVYRQIEDREYVTVMCKYGKTHSTHKHTETFNLSVESELNYTMEILKCSSDSLEIRVFMVTVSPPASFTCVHEFNFSHLHSQTYNYSGSVLDHHEDIIHHSSFYICISSFIAVCLFIITAAVIVTVIRSKTKDTNTAAVADYDYLEA